MKIQLCAVSHNNIEIKSLKCFHTYSSNGQILPLQSKVSINSTSSSSSWKSQMPKFSLILDFVTDLGITMWPCWIWYLSTIWAAVLPYLSAICLILGSSKSRGSSGLAHGRSGDPRGLYAVIIIPFDLQNADSFFWFRYGWHSI